MEVDGLKERILEAIKARILQPNSVKGLIGFTAGAVGLQISNNLQQAIAFLLIAAYGVFDVWYDERKAAKKVAAQTAATVASDVSAGVAADVAQAAALTAIEQNTPWLAGIPPQEAIQRPQPNRKD